MSPLRGDTVNCPLCQCSMSSTDCVALAQPSPNLPVTPDYIINTTDADQLFECGHNGVALFAPTWVTDPPSVSITCTIDQVVPWNTQWPLFFNQDFYDTDNMHSNEDQISRITFNTAGIYLVNLIVRWKKGDFSRGDVMTGIRKNTLNFLAMDAQPLSDETDIYVTQNVAVIHLFRAGEYVEAAVRQDGEDPDGEAVNLPVTAESFSPIFSAQFLRPAP